MWAGQDLAPPPDIASGGYGRCPPRALGARDGRPLPTSEVAARPAKWFREQNRGCTLPDGGKNRFREQNGGLVLPQGLEEELPGTKRGSNVPGEGWRSDQEGWRAGMSVSGVPKLGTPGMIWPFFVPGVPVLGTPGTVVARRRFFASLRMTGGVVDGGCGWKVERMGVGGDNLRRVGREMGVRERANGVRGVGNYVVGVGKNVVEEGKKAVLGKEMWGWGVQPTAFLLFLQML